MEMLCIARKTRLLPCLKAGVSAAQKNDDVKLQTLYVHRQLLNAEEVVDWAREQGFKLCMPPDELHVTLIYSKQKVNWDDTTPMVDRLRIHGGNRSMERFGDALVLRFESSDLEERWREFLEIGCAHGFPTYHPHVTISYKDKLRKPKEIRPFTGELVFGPEIFRPTLSSSHPVFPEMKISESMILDDRWFGAPAMSSR